MKNSITSNYMKRLEIQHIGNLIAELHTIPDFGYEADIPQENFEGWKNLQNYIANSSKYERLQNFVQARFEYKNNSQKAKIAKLLENKRALEK